MTSDNPQPQDQPSEQERAERVADAASRWVGRVVGRAREEAEDIWAEAQSLRHEERSVMRRGFAYGLAGAIRAGERISAVARGAAEGARSASHSGAPASPSGAPASQSGAAANGDTPDAVTEASGPAANPD